MESEILKTFLFWTLILAFLLNNIEGHTCEYRFPKINDLINGIKFKNPNLRGKRVLSNLRIYYDYQNSFNNLPDSDILKRAVLEPARDKIQSLLKVKAASNGILLVDRACEGHLYKVSQNGIVGCSSACMETKCINVVVPDRYLKKCCVIDNYGMPNYSGVEGSGITNYDIVLLITASNCGGDTLAYAASCFIEKSLDRPILGILNICSDHINARSKIKENIKVVMHEIIHALGVSVDKFAFYRYQNGVPIVPRNSFGWPSLGINPNGYFNWNDIIIKRVMRIRSSVSTSTAVLFYGLVLPNVLKAAREHFNCPTLDAVDLENYGSSTDGSAMSHFDEYFLHNELMTPQSNNGMDVLSKITLALLQDTGWYIADLNGAGNLDYGYRAGCVLPQFGCYTYMMSKMATSSSLDPFCNEPLRYRKRLRCSRFSDYFSYCSLYKYERIPAENQYFTHIAGVPDNDVQYYSGPSPYNEYCPIFLIEANPSTVCTDELNNYINNPKYIIPSYFGSDSICIPSDVYDIDPKPSYGASCQKFTGDFQSGNFKVIIKDFSFNCPSSIIYNYTFRNGLHAAFRCPEYNKPSWDPSTWPSAKTSTIFVQSYSNTFVNSTSTTATSSTTAVLITTTEICNANSFQVNYNVLHWFLNFMNSRTRS